MNQYPATSLSGMVDRLAPNAGAKYRALEQRRDEVRALIKVVLESDKDIDARGAVLAAAINSKDPADPGLARLQQQREQLAAESQKLGQRLARLQSEHGSLEQTISRLQNALHGIYAAPDAPPVIAELRDGESASDAVLRLRAEIGRKQSELQRLKSAPPMADEQRVWVRQQVALMRQGGPRLEVTPTGQLELASPDISKFAPPGAGLLAPSGSALRLFACLFPERLIEYLEQQISESPNAVPQVERPRLIEQLELEILRLERIEEHFISLTEAQGVEVHRRFAANPMAILGLATLADIQDMALPEELQAAE